MEVHLDSEEAAMARRDRKGKRRRPQGRIAAAPAEVAAQTGRVLAEREAEWLDRLASDPASFAAVEREVHEQARRQADLYVAGLLAKASEHPEMAQHVDAVTAAAEVPLRPVEKKDARWWSAFWAGLAITVMTLYCSPRGRTGKGRGREGSGLYPELAAYRISEGSSPNVQAEVGRLVGLLPIEQARAELARRGLESGREGGAANRQRTGGADAGDSHPRPAPVPPRGIARGRGVRGQAGRGRDRWRPGPGADRRREGPRRRQDEAEEVPRSSGASPRW